MRVLAILVLCSCVLSPGWVFGQGQSYGEVFMGYGKTGDDSSADAFGLWAGYPVSDGFSVEVGFLYLGKYSKSVLVDVVKGGSDFVTFSADSVSSLNLGVRGTLVLDRGMSLYGRAGLAMWDVGVSVDGDAGDVVGDGHFFTDSSDGSDFYIGLAATIDISPTSYFLVDCWFLDADGIDMASVGVGLGMDF
ncbi:MAG: hypothetical protein CMJ95_00905 [Planctomycetes bacterium]|nr:hypothetical protein [Planctomycetota bacterium]